MVEINPLQIEIEREDDGRFLASVPELPGVMAYGDTQDAAVRKVKAICSSGSCGHARAVRRFRNRSRSCSRREHLDFYEGEACLRGAAQKRLDAQEIGRIAQEAAAAGLAEFHLLLPRP